MMRNTVRTRDRIEYKVLAKIFKELRAEAGMSQESLGNAIGRGQAYVWKIENGAQVPDFATILDIIEVTGGDAPAIIAKVQAEAKKKGKR